MSTHRVDQVTDVTNPNQLVGMAGNDRVVGEQEYASPEIGQFFLRIFDGVNEFYTRTLLDGETLVGRSESCEIKIKIPSVSRSHCVITVKKGAVTIRDNDSSNGTFIDGSRIAKEALIEVKQAIGIGSVMMILCQQA